MPESVLLFTIGLGYIFEKKKNKQKTYSFPLILTKPFCHMPKEKSNN